jgi:hypothetical protein
VPRGAIRLARGRPPAGPRLRHVALLAAAGPCWRAIWARRGPLRNPPADYGPTPLGPPAAALPPILGHRGGNLARLAGPSIGPPGAGRRGEELKSTGRQIPPAQIFSAHFRHVGRDFRWFRVPILLVLLREIFQWRDEIIFLRGKVGAWLLGGLELRAGRSVLAKAGRLEHIPPDRPAPGISAPARPGAFSTPAAAGGARTTPTNSIAVILSCSLCSGLRLRPVQTSQFRWRVEPARRRLRSGRSARAISPAEETAGTEHEASTTRRPTRGDTASPLGRERPATNRGSERRSGR